MEETYTSDLFKRVAREMGVILAYEPVTGQVGEMFFAGGRRHLFKNCNPNLNLSVSVEAARDKAYTHYFLDSRGIPSPRFEALRADDPASLGRAARFAGEVGYPVFVKPNNLGEGRMVFKAHDPAELAKWAGLVLAKNEAGIVEALCAGNDYRVVMLDGEVISAYQRIPLSVVGNGRDTVDALLAEEKDALPSLGRPSAEIDPADPRIDACLAWQGRDRSYVPAADERVPLLHNANLSTGGTSVDLTDSLHPSFADLAAQTAAALGLRLAGVDFMAADLTEPVEEQIWNVIEVNGEPDLDNYASVGPEQEERLAVMFRKIIGSIDDGAAP